MNKIKCNVVAFIYYSKENGKQRIQPDKYYRKRGVVYIKFVYKRLLYMQVKRQRITNNIKVIMSNSIMFYILLIKAIITY